MAVVIDAGAISFENVAVTATLSATPVALFAGLVALTTGATWTVLKLQVKSFASGPPNSPWAPVVIVAVYVVPNASGAFGLNVAVVPHELTTPGTAGEIVNVAAPIVAATIFSENVAVTATSRATFTALSAGLVDATVGGEVAGGAEQPASAKVSDTAIHLRMKSPKNSLEPT